ncbi:MAG TPA: HAD family phosphatase [Abditibacteriaceae bacterium]|jgi:beta-phosphoglucomutase family hydrolase
MTFQTLLETTRAEALLFDMDGTLVDNMGYHRQTWIEWSKREGLPGTEAEILAQTHGTIGEIVRRFFPHITDDAELFAIGERKEALYREIYAPHLRLIPGLSAVLEAAKERGFPIALATAGDRTNVAFTIDGLDVRRYFDAIVSGEDVQHGKPNPEVFLIAAQRLGITPEKCLVFEDSPEGAEAARLAGMPCVVINPMKPRDQFGDVAHVLNFAPDYRWLTQ